MVSVSRESYTPRRPRVVVDGSPENERAAAGEAPARDGVEGMMERIGGRGSDGHAQFSSKSARRFLSSVYSPVDFFYVR